MRIVAALFVDPNGPYAAIPDVECWDAARDALTYAWPAFGLTPPPAFGWQKTFDGEWVCEVHQSAYGHDARKPTWLLLVGALPGATRWDKPRGRKVVGHFAQRHPGDFNDSRTHAERMRADETHITPVAFAEYLVGLAREVGVA